MPNQSKGLPARFRPYDMHPTAPGSGSVCMTQGSVQVTLFTNDGHAPYSACIYTANPGVAPSAPVCGQLSTVYTSGGNTYYTGWIGAGNSPSPARWVEYKDHIGSTVLGSFGAYTCNRGTIQGFECGPSLPIALAFKLHPGVKDVQTGGSRRLNKRTVLIHTGDPLFRCRWFSDAIDIGVGDGLNPAFWMLQRTSVDGWSLFLRRVSNDIALYSGKQRGEHTFPLTLKRMKVDKEFKQWPARILIKKGP